MVTGIEPRDYGKPTKVNNEADLAFIFLLGLLFMCGLGIGLSLGQVFF